MEPAPRLRPLRDLCALRCAPEACGVPPVRPQGGEARRPAAARVSRAVGGRVAPWGKIPRKVADGEVVVAAVLAVVLAAELYLQTRRYWMHDEPTVEQEEDTQEMLSPELLRQRRQLQAQRAAVDEQITALRQERARIDRQLDGLVDGTC